MAVLTSFSSLSVSIVTYVLPELCNFVLGSFVVVQSVCFVSSRCWMAELGGT